MNTKTTPIDMVFSRTDAKPQTILKVVELNRLKNPKVNGAILGGSSAQPAPSAGATPSFSEVFLKPEPLFENTMFHESDSEFFQNLAPWCGQTAEGAVQSTIDLKKDQESAHNSDTLHTPITPQGWEFLSPNSPGFSSSTISAFNYPTSPNEDVFSVPHNEMTNAELENKHERLNWEIENMPVVLEPGTLVPEKSYDFNLCDVMDSIETYNTHEHTFRNTHNTFIMDEDSSDIKLGSVVPTELDNGVVIGNYVVKNSQGTSGVLEPAQIARPRPVLTLSVSEKAPWSGDTVSTPDIVDIVAQLDKEAQHQQLQSENQLLWPLDAEGEFTSFDIPSTSATPSIDYEPITPPEPVTPEPIALKPESPFDSDDQGHKSFRKRKLHNDSEDSDEPYVPYATTKPTRKHRRRKHVPIQDLIHELEKAQPKEHEKPRRGRPPIRRASVVSSVHSSADDNSSSISTHEMKYRELRDKNNEASKRSRMNRKLKELQMEQLAAELEERNKKLKVRADILEDMTKRMKERLMTAILQK